MLATFKKKKNCENVFLCLNLSNKNLIFFFRIRDVLSEPQEILAMYASERQMEKGETVMLKEIICQGHNLFIVVDTTW